MPKCKADSVLQDQVHRFLSKNRLTVNGAATLLGLDRTTFWRFQGTGKALRCTKDRIREALEIRNKGFFDGVADDVDGADASRHQARLMLQTVVADREIKQIRKACESVLALLTVYEAQQSLSENSTGASTR